MDCHEARQLFEEHRRRELPPDRAQALEAHLAGCPACRAFWAREEAVATLVRALPRSPAPPALARQIRNLGTRRHGIVGWLGRPWVAAAVAALVVAAVLAPWLRRPAERPGDIVDALIQSGVAEHRRILLELEAGAIVVDDPDALFARVRSVADVELPKILAGTGELRLLAAKPTLLVSRKTAAAALRYPTSPVTTYFILPGKDLPMPTEGRVQIEQYRPHMRQVNGFNIVYWKQQDMVYLMVSGLDREGCQKLYLKMRKAL
jgi:anti-sigma factor RsiW